MAPTGTITAFLIPLSFIKTDTTLPLEARKESVWDYLFMEALLAIFTCAMAILVFTDPNTAPDASETTTRLNVQLREDEGESNEQFRSQDPEVQSNICTEIFDSLRRPILALMMVFNMFGFGLVATFGATITQILTNLQYAEVSIEPPEELFSDFLVDLWSCDHYCLHFLWVHRIHHLLHLLPAEEMPVQSYHGHHLVIVSKNLEKTSQKI